ncbi:MAG: hypothetical protein JWM16_1565 [Verrucomicrobiales bacterium]|nr:hypothetical protein [Verrucomicrobiales bacterium]
MSENRMANDDQRIRNVRKECTASALCVALYIYSEADAGRARPLPDDRMISRQRVLIRAKEK